VNAVAGIVRVIIGRCPDGGVTAPLVVLLHELATVLLEGAGIDARLTGFSMGCPSDTRGISRP